MTLVVRVISGVVDAFATVTANPFAVATESVVTVPFPVPAPISDLKFAADLAVTVLSAFILRNVSADGFVNVNRFSPTVVPPREALWTEADSVVMLLSAFIFKNVVADGFARVNMF